MSRLLPLAALLLAACPCAAQAPPRLKLDRDRLQFDRVRFDGPIASEDANPDEVRAYCDVLLHARQFDTADLVAGGDRFVTFADLLDRKAGRSWQFDLLTLRLNLKSCRPFPAPRLLAERGVPTLYECWLFVPPSDRAVCLVVSELPPGLEPDPNYATSKPATVAGYFFKLLHYTSRERDPDHPGEFLTRRAPLLLGHSFAVDPPPPAPPEPLGGWLVPAVAATLALLGAAAVGVVLILRAGDRAARRARRPSPEAPPPFGM